ncbi:hypothetical protein JCM10212_005220 [Sporobolomyces blumeae]
MYDGSSTSWAGSETPGAAAPVTRSMARRRSILALSSEPADSAALPAGTSNRTSLPSARRASTASSTSTAPPVPRTRSSTSLASRSSTLTSKSAVSSLSTSRARRVLVEQNAHHAAPAHSASSSSTRPSINPRSSNMSSASGASSSSHAIAASGIRRSASSSVASMRSPPAQHKARRYSRAEAGGLTGFGIVRAGPKVVSPVKAEHTTVAAADPMRRRPAATVARTNDPYSTSFRRPTFAFEEDGREDPDQATSTWPADQALQGSRGEGSNHREDEDELFLPSPHKSNPFEPYSPSKLNLSPSKPYVFPLSSPTKRSPFYASPDKRQVDLDRGVENMDLETTIKVPPIQPSSPVRGALSPRKLLSNSLNGDLARSKPARKIDEVESSSDEEGDDEIDFLSPRKKAKLPSSASFSTIRPTPTSTRPTYSSRIARARTSGGGSAATRPGPDRPLVLRSPPPKKSTTALIGAGTSTAVSTRSRIGPESTAMQRTDGRPFALPSTLPPPPPLSTSLSQPAAPRSATSSNSASSTLPSTKSSATPLVAHSAPSASRLPRRVSLEHPNLTHSLPPPAPSALLVRSTSPTFSDPSLSLMSIDESREASFSSEIAPSTASHDAGNISVVSNVSLASARSGSQETAQRLANLQNMLSKLQMPRRQSLGSRPAASSSTAGSTSPNRRTSGGASGANESSLMSRIGAPIRMKEDRDEVVPLAPPGEPTSRSTATKHTRRSSIPTTTASVVGRAIRPEGPSASSKASASSSTTIRASEPAPSGASRISTRPASRRISSSYLPSQSFDLSVAHQSNTASSFDVTSLSDASATAVLTDTTSRLRQESSVLNGVVAFVDVRTAEGDDSGMIFVDMLKSMGARVTTRPSSLTTHVVFKAGRPSTLQFVRSCVSRPPRLVGIAWVVRCAEIGRKADEEPFLLHEEKQEVEKENSMFAIGAGKTAPAQKRRRSMEPKALAALNNSTTSIASSNPSLKASIAASLDRARLRSLQFAPKVGSPLAKRVFVMPDEPADGGDDDDDAMDE